MKFGKDFKTHLEETLPEWRDKFLCYKPLKKLLKQFPATSDGSLTLRPTLLLQQFPPFPDSVVSSASPPVDAPPAVDHHHHPESPSNRSSVLLQEWFVGILNVELNKFNDFFVDKEEEFIIRFQELKERIEYLKEQSSKNGVLTSKSEFSEEMMDIRKDLVTIHGEMVLLKNYSSLNFAGLVKILKKYDKRTGGLLCLPFTQLALHQPFFTTGSLTKLVHECEANLELLFPLHAEVIESTNVAERHPNPPLNNPSNISCESSPTLGNNTMDIYHSTLAAMKAIRGLQKASSTYNPLSFSSLFKNQNDESNGAVTTDNSDSNSSASLHNGDEFDQDVHSI